MTGRVRYLRDPETGRFAAPAAHATPVSAPLRQAGAIPYRLGADGLHFLLVTSRGSGRWIFPKGGRHPGETAARCAAREAFEEAGLEGRVAAAPLGAYRGVRSARPGDPRRARRSAIEVEMYPLEVTRQHDDWPEKASRRRRWATPAETDALLADRDLAALAEQAAARILAPAAPARVARRAAR